MSWELDPETRTKVSLPKSAALICIGKPCMEIHVLCICGHMR